MRTTVWNEVHLMAKSDVMMLDREIAFVTESGYMPLINGKRSLGSNIYKMAASPDMIRANVKKVVAQYAPIAAAAGVVFPSDDLKALAKNINWGVDDK